MRWGFKLKKSSWFVTTSLVMVPVGCSFALDFDKLEGPELDTTQCENCDDPAPCDGGSSCASADAESDDRPRGCIGDQVGLVSATHFAPLEANTVHKTQLSFTEYGLYQVAHIEDNDERQDVWVRAFQPGSDQPTASLRLSDTTSNGDIVTGPAALVVSDGPFPLTLYLPLKQPGDGLATLKRVDLPANLDASSVSFDTLTDAPNYFTPQPGPAAGLLYGNVPFVVWHGCRATETSLGVSTPCSPGDAAVFGHAGTAPLASDELASEGLTQNNTLQGLVALGGGTSPAAAWLTSPSDSTVEVSMGVPAEQVQNDVRLCHSEPGYLGHTLHSTPLIGERSSISWSKSDGSEFITEATAVFCRSDGCTDTAGVATADECTNEQLERRVLPGVSNLVLASLSRMNASDGAQLSAWAESSSTGTTALWLQWHEGNSDPNTTAPLSETSLSRQELPVSDEGLAASDSLALSVLNPAAHAVGETEIVAVGWTQRQGGADVVQLRSFHLCPRP